MKHILILISILLLSSPVIGQETGVLYQYETSSDFVWKSVGSKELQPKYEGEIIIPMDSDLLLIRMTIKVSLENGKMVKSGTPNILKKMEHL